MSKIRKKIANFRDDELWDSTFEEWDSPIRYLFHNQKVDLRDRLKNDLLNLYENERDSDWLPDLTEEEAEYLAARIDRWLRKKLDELAELLTLLQIPVCIAEKDGYYQVIAEVDDWYTIHDSSTGLPVLNVKEGPFLDLREAMQKFKKYA